MAKMVQPDPHVKAALQASLHVLWLASEAALWNKTARWGSDGAVGICSKKSLASVYRLIWLDIC